MLRVVVVGYGEMFTNLVAGTLDSGMEIVGVLRKDSVKYPRFLRWLKDMFNPSIEYNYIKSYNLPELYSRGVNTEDFRKKLLNLNPDVVLVGSWGEKFEKATFDIPKIATINAHPSLLPKYRGPNPYFWVIRNQEQTSGVTFHLMDEGFDTGAILAQEEVKIYPSDTGKSLKDKTVLVARGAVCELLKALNEDIIIPLQQREDKASYYSHPEGLELDFKKTAEENYALIRAIYPWNEAYFYHNITPFSLNPHKITIEENSSKFTECGTIVECNPETKTIAVLCADNKILKMAGVNLYKKYDRPFTRNYITREIKVGDFII
ncbi:MAG: hypothetical protein E7Z92_06965 [Cyanobacteria bacterium SIG31]|nr:hypothetical protein [Cyanobacteria bacterium SIG31]